MKEAPRSLRIYLADGTATGLRHIEVDNWSGQCLVCPRASFERLKSWQEAQRPGVYWLFGEGRGERPAAYVGEAENVLSRLATHLKNKDFWREAVLFTSKDTSFTKAHSKYLEARFVELTRTADRYELLNGNTPTGAKLPRSDVSAMDRFLRYARLVLTTLGHRPLDPVAGPGPGPGQRLFELGFPDICANGQLDDEGMTVLAGSQCRAEPTKSFGPKYRALRDRLIEQGILTREGSVYVFQRSYTFNSPSAAASVVRGSMLNGRRAWKTADGTPLGEWEDKAARDLEAASEEDT